MVFAPHNTQPEQKEQELWILGHMQSLSHKSLRCTSHCWGQPTPPAPRISAGPDLLEPQQPHGAAHMGVITRPNPAPIWYPSTSSTTATAGYSPTHTHTHACYHRRFKTLRFHWNLAQNKCETSQINGNLQWNDLTERQRDGNRGNSQMTALNSSRTQQLSQ